MSSNIITHLVFFPTTYPTLRASTANFAIPSYFTIPKNYFINYTIPFYNTPNIPKLYFFFPILFKYSFLILFFTISLFLFLFLSFSLNLQHWPQQIKPKQFNTQSPPQPPCHHQYTVTPTYPSTSHWTIKPKPRPH